jgi:hypothetical protein
VIERRFERAAAWCAASALLSAIGLMHAYSFTAGDTRLVLAPAWPFVIGYGDGRHLRRGALADGAQRHQRTRTYQHARAASALRPARAALQPAPAWKTFPSATESGTIARGTQGAGEPRSHPNGCVPLRLLAPAGICTLNGSSKRNPQASAATSVDGSERPCASR